MNIETIRERIYETDLRPFAVVTSRGCKYPVPHRDFIFTTPRVVIVAKLNGNTIGVDPLHVVGLEDLPPSKRRARKQRQKR